MHRPLFLVPAFGLWLASVAGCAASAGAGAGASASASASPTGGLAAGSASAGGSGAVAANGGASATGSTGPSSPGERAGTAGITTPGTSGMGTPATVGNSRENPVMRCGPRDSYAYVATDFRCADGANPFGGDLRLGQQSRRGNVGANSAGHIIDVYVVPCAEGPREVYVDMYGCGAMQQRLDNFRAPRGIVPPPSTGGRGFGGDQI